MNLSAIDLNLLVALEALISEAHVGRAARKIGLSQPAASHALYRLRELLGDPLLVRVGSRMQLTPRAVGLRESLPAVLSQIKALLVADSFAPETSSRRFSVMMQDHVAHLIVPALVNRVRSQASGVRLKVLPWQSLASMAPERLRSVDLLVSCSDKDVPGFQRQTLFTDTEVTVVRADYPSVSRLKILEAFLNARHVAVVGRGLAEDPVDAWLREKGLKRQVVLDVPGYVQALQAVAQSDLVAFVPKRLAQSLSAELSLRLIPPPTDPGEYQEYLFHPRRSEQDAASIWLRNLTHEIGAGLYGLDAGRTERLGLPRRVLRSNRQIGGA